MRHWNIVKRLGLCLKTGLILAGLWGEVSLRGDEARGDRPNVILIMTDDQGYGDLSVHGNPILKTPNLDQLAAESIRFTDFHVSPFCTPTRAALMTGRYPARTGAYRTSSGRTMMHTDEQSIAKHFAASGYRTGMIGKWHLGDNAPHRPQDRGFQDVVWHRCGGVGQASDYWGNDYFDDTYERNGRFESFEGYCTDVWFEEAARFIESNRDKPFFLYLAPNAPHGPYRVPPEWKQPYETAVNWRSGDAFYGMVANIDHNVGLLRKRLEKLGLSENTILIFMTDNGTANGAKFASLTSEASSGYNAGMRGKKSSIYEGGHRVPFFIHWPKGGLVGGRDLKDLAAHLDVLPTLADLCGVGLPSELKLDGVSFAAKLREPTRPSPREHLIVQFQGGAYFRSMPRAWEDSCVLQGPWRLINGKELYHIERDLAQREDLADAHPEIVRQLREIYLPFWNAVSPRITPVSIDLGNPDENPVRLCSQDWYLPSGNPPWHFAQISKLPKVNGPWMVHVRKAGSYRFVLRQFPAEADKPLEHCVRARIEIAGKVQERELVKGSKEVSLEMDLPLGKTSLKASFLDADNQVRGAYFVDVTAF